MPALKDNLHKSTRQLLVDLDMLVTVKENSLAIQLAPEKLCAALNHTPESADEIVQPVVIDLPMRIRKRGVEMKLVIGEVKKVDPTLIKAVARGRA